MPKSKQFEFSTGRLQLWQSHHPSSPHHPRADPNFGIAQVEVRDQRQLLRNDGLLLLPVVSEPRARRVSLLRHHPVPIRPSPDASRPHKLGPRHPRVRKQVLVPPGRQAEGVPRNDGTQTRGVPLVGRRQRRGRGPVLHLVPNRLSEGERVGGLRHDRPVPTQQRQVHVPAPAVRGSVPASHVHQLQPGKSDPAHSRELGHQRGGRAAADDKDERGHQAEVGRSRASKLREKCRVEVGGRPLGYGGSLFRPHPRGLPPLPHPGGHPTPGLEARFFCRHFGQES